jgi:roadblock/LC7 domain-containing protein
MTTFEPLLKLPGIMAAFEFRGSGELLDYQIVDPDGPLDKSVMDLLAHMCAANLSIATMQARGWETITDMKGYYPIKQFTLVGFDWSVVVSGLRREAEKNAGATALSPFLGVVMANESADYEVAFKRLEA